MEDDYLHRQLVRLGDMMGDGLHHESDGKWIEKEYAKIFNTLYPEHKKERRRRSIERINERVKPFVDNHKCTCGGSLKQSRSGSLTLECTECTLRFKIKQVRNGNT